MDTLTKAFDLVSIGKDYAKEKGISSTFAACVQEFLQAHDYECQPSHGC